MSFVTEKQICHWCKQPMPDPLPDGTIYDGGWIHPECGIAKHVAERLKGQCRVHIKSEVGIEVRSIRKFF